MFLFRSGHNLRPMISVIFEDFAVGVDYQHFLTAGSPPKAPPDCDSSPPNWATSSTPTFRKACWDFPTPHLPPISPPPSLPSRQTRKVPPSEGDFSIPSQDNVRAGKRPPLERRTERFGVLGDFLFLFIFRFYSSTQRIFLLLTFDLISSLLFDGCFVSFSLPKSNLPRPVRLVIRVAFSRHFFFGKSSISRFLSVLLSFEWA